MRIVEHHGEECAVPSFKPTVSKPAAAALVCAIVGSVALWLGIFVIADAAL
jgi:hypothetical protein